MSDKTKASAPAAVSVETTVTREILAPTAVINAVKAFDKAEKGFNKNSLNLAIAAREFGRSTTEKDDKVRMALAAAIATAKGIDVAMVVASKGGDRSAYQLLSNLTRIARPKDKPEQDAVDNLIDEAKKEDTKVTYSDMLKAARAPRAGANKRDTDAGTGDDSKGKAGSKAKAFTLDSLTIAVGELVQKAIGAEIPDAKIKAAVDSTLAATLEKFGNGSK